MSTMTPPACAALSVFELFTIGIGPSSSHTVGPLRAGAAFAAGLGDALGTVTRIRAELFGSLAMTGIGHGTPDALVVGLEGAAPETVDPDAVRGAWNERARRGTLLLGGRHPVAFERTDILFRPQRHPGGHPNTLVLSAWSPDETLLLEETWLSVGGGFIRREGESEPARPAVPLSFTSAADLLTLCADNDLDLAGLARHNELAQHSEDALNDRLDTIWAAMDACIERGLHTGGILPGGLGVVRRAAQLRQRLEESSGPFPEESSAWLQAFALAVNEENAAGSRIVTAPTNGAAGILPAVGAYYLRFITGATPERMRDYLLTAATIGSLIKRNASISGAEGGCQAEVGSACAMAAAGLCQILGGTPEQVENAAEIALEHHLGLTCDPVGGLVQIPCIERNAIASATAINAARLALNGDGSHIVPLDTVIETMRQTGADMSSKYKETSTGGLAVNVVEC